MATTETPNFGYGMEGIISDHEVYGLRIARPLRGTLRDSRGGKRYFEVVAFNRVGQDLGKGWNAIEAYQDAASRA